MTTLWLTDEQAAQIAADARAAAPHEVCGLLAGRDGQVLRVIPVPNTAADRTRHYVMDATGLSQHLPRLAKDGLELLAFYHSHPKHDPIPSPTDVAQAHYPATAQLIVSLKHSAASFGAWQIAYGAVSPVALHIRALPPTHVADDPPLSTAQRSAVLISALLAFTVLVTAALALLPPAPPIP
ncbi:MAG: M67 family metallopeptidase [Armatimonadetes bacterium]|nr:M67 family metallopeptidase [Anaerolineae bacterium]